MIQVAANSLDLYVLGIHGDTQVTAWSSAAVGGIPLKKALPPGKLIKEKDLENECKNRSRSIIRAKGATPFGIGTIVSSICASILFDKHNIRPVSHFQPEYGCCFSYPAVLGRTGIGHTVHMPLSMEEEQKVTESVTAMKEKLLKVKELIS